MDWIGLRDCDCGWLLLLNQIKPYDVKTEDEF